MKEKEFFNIENHFKVNQKSLLEIKDTPFIYWLTNNELEEQTEANDVFVDDYINKEWFQSCLRKWKEELKSVLRYF